MPTKTKTKTKDRRDVYERVTERIIRALDEGTVPWHRPWTSLSQMPANLKTRKAYRGVNVWLLALEADARGFAQPWWLTFKQAKEMGGTVRGGEKGTSVILWKPVVKTPCQVRGCGSRWDKISGQTWFHSPKCEQESETFYLLRSYSVFNIEQIDGIDLPPEPEQREHTPHEVAAQIISDMPNRPETRHAGARAYYEPTMDRVTLPVPESFESDAAYYSTAFHEFAHSTAHESRLGRKIGGRFGDDSYAGEELVAELTAAMLCATAGVAADYDNSAAYIDHWRKQLSDDNRLIVTAASQAQRAADYIRDTA